MHTPIVYQKDHMVVVSALHDGQAPVFVNDVGWHKTPSGHSFGPAIRPYYLLHLIVDGKGEVERNGRVTRLGAGDAFLICPDETTVYRADINEPWEYYWISFYGGFTPQLIRQTTNELYARYQKSGLLALRSAVHNHTDDPIQLLNVLFCVLTAVQTTQKAVSSGDEVIASAMQYLETNYFNEIDVSTLSASFGYSRSHFSTLFLKHTGDSPYRYLIKLRLEKAKEFLQNTSHSIEEIAYSIGFSSVGRFCELFKKYNAVSPSQYRRSIIS